ncbi:MAG: hypothetical protein COB38_05345 [Gammaproteobacteria bacterium]|nr:MAG: hypothetical protein COB38_05345 [Gammaproteobacteria bacterium]
MSWLFKIKQNEKIFRFTIFSISIFPAILLYYKYSTAGLGINPFATLSHQTGHIAIVYILLTLSITPIRRFLCNVSIKLNLNRGKRLSDWNFLIKSRRQLGLFSFFYSALHLSAYLFLDIGWSWEYFSDDLAERSFIIYGLVNFIMLFLLAITSPTIVRKKMGRWWKKVHRLMYLIAILSIVHFVFAAKHGNNWSIVYGTICLVLLSNRAWIFLSNKSRRQKDDGLETYRN